MECKDLVLLDIYSAFVLYYTILNHTSEKIQHLCTKKKKKKQKPLVKNI